MQIINDKGFIVTLKSSSFKLSDSTGGPQVAGVSSDEDKFMSSEESEIESDEEEREKR